MGAAWVRLVCGMCVAWVRQAAMKKAKAHPSKEARKRAEKEVEVATSAANSKVTAIATPSPRP